LILKGDEDQILRYWEILDCLEQRKDTEGEEFLLTCFNQCDKLAKVKAAKNSHVAGADLMVRLSSLLYNIGSPAINSCSRTRGICRRLTCPSSTRSPRSWMRSSWTITSKPSRHCEA
jgi:hypothetical protein